MKRKEIISLLLIILAGALVYANTFGNEFLWDDELLILKNSLITSWKHLPTLFSTHLFQATSRYGSFYRPLQSLSFMFDYSIWGHHPFGYHLTNLLLHLGCALLIFYLVGLMGGKEETRLLSALLFTVHPLHTEAVTYISGRADPLMLVFFLSGIIFYLKHLRFSPPRRVYYLGAILSFLLALLSKEIALMFLPCLVLSEIFCYRKENEKVSWTRRGGRWGPFLLISAAYAYLRMTVLNFREGVLWECETGLLARLFTSLKVFGEYLRLLILPFGLHMERQIEIAQSFREKEVLFSLAILLILLTITIFSFRRNRLFSWGMLWFFIACIPLFHFFPLIAPMAEHWLYVPSIGIFTCAAVGLSRLLRIKRTLPLVVAIFLFYGTLTVMRNRDWKDGITLFKNTLRYSPQVPSLHGNLASAYRKKGYRKEGFVEYQREIELDPNSFRAYYNLGICYFEEKNYNEALRYLNKAIALAPDTSRFYAFRGNIYKVQNDYLRAKEDYQKALSLSPFDFTSHFELAEIHSHLGRKEEALAGYRKAVKLNPKFADVHLRLGKLYLEEEKFSEVAEEFKLVARLRPLWPEAHYNLGSLYARLGKFSLAEKKLKEAVRLKPDYAEAHNNLGSLYCLQGRLDEARLSYRKALELNPDFEEARVNLQNIEDQKIEVE